MNRDLATYDTLKHHYIDIVTAALTTTVYCFYNLDDDSAVNKHIDIRKRNSQDYYLQISLLFSTAI